VSLRSLARIRTCALGVIVPIVSFAGCKGGEDPPPPDAGPCWAVEGTTPSGTIEMGTGESTWIPVPDTMELRTGSQGAGFLFINARIQGLDGGDPSNFLAAGNPRTRLTAKLVDGQTIGDPCPSRVGYATNGDGFDYWARGQMLVFLPFSAEQVANNTNVAVTLEIIDAAGHYAKHDKTIFVTPRPR